MANAKIRLKLNLRYFLKNSLREWNKFSAVILFPVPFSFHFKVLVSPISLSCYPMFFFVVLKAFQTAHPGCPAFCIYQFILRLFLFFLSLEEKYYIFFKTSHYLVFGDKSMKLLEIWYRFVDKNFGIYFFYMSCLSVNSINLPFYTFYISKCIVKFL